MVPNVVGHAHRLSGEAGSPRHAPLRDSPRVDLFP